MIAIILCALLLWLPGNARLFIKDIRTASNSPLQMSASIPSFILVTSDTFSIPHIWLFTFPSSFVQG
jgi:hypothetical protein